MAWLNFLHFYQPANQQKDILEAVTNESYRPILQKIASLDDAKITLNITGALLELFEKYEYNDVLELIRGSVKNGKIELTGTCKYHALLPLIPEKEAKIQIEENQRTLERILGFEYKPAGFFPPEMAYHPKLNRLLQKMGFKWIILDEIALRKNDTYLVTDSLFRLENTDILIFPRNRRISNLIMSAVARDIETLHQAIREELKLPYFVTGMDGETFGHHRIGLENFLFEILENPVLGSTSIGAFMENQTTQRLQVIAVSPNACTWASSPQDIEKDVQFLSWDDPENPIHKVQWEFTNWVLELVYEKEVEGILGNGVREKLNKALASDHFWWASAKPWWSLEMIEDGAFRLLDVVLSMDTSQEAKFKAHKYYMEIVSKASEWQRQGIVREMAMRRNEILRIPFKDRTLGQGGAEEGVYWAFIDMMRQEEKKASQRGDYEKAILWRDAIYKLEHKYDIYDTVNVIDLLRLEIGNGEVEKTIKEYKEKYDRMRGGQPEQRDA